MSYEAAVEALKEHIWSPADHTTSFWIRDRWGGVIWSENDEESQDMDEWDETYSAETFREVTERDGYVIGTVEDGSGGNYQIVFSLEKELIDHPFG